MKPQIPLHLECCLAIEGFIHDLGGGCYSSRHGNHYTTKTRYKIIRGGEAKNAIRDSLAGLNSILSGMGTTLFKYMPALPLLQMSGCRVL